MNEPIPQAIAAPMTRSDLRIELWNVAEAFSRLLARWFMPPSLTASILDVENLFGLQLLSKEGNSEWC